MEEMIHDPNRKDRREFYAGGLFICALAVILLVMDPTLAAVAVAAVFGGLLIIFTGIIGRPYVMLDRNGMTFRLLFRMRFCAWAQVRQAGIRDTRAKKAAAEYRFPLVILLPGETSDPLVRDLFQTVLLPNRKEVREFVTAHYGPLDFNETDGLNDWEKRYLGFD